MESGSVSSRILAMLKVSKTPMTAADFGRRMGKKVAGSGISSSLTLLHRDGALERSRDDSSGRYAYTFVRLPLKGWADKARTPQQGQQQVHSPRRTRKSGLEEQQKLFGMAMMRAELELAKRTIEQILERFPNA